MSLILRHNVTAAHYIRIDPPPGLVAMNKHCSALSHHEEFYYRNECVSSATSLRPIWLTLFWACHIGDGRKNVRRLCAKPRIGSLCKLKEHFLAAAQKTQQPRLLKKDFRYHLEQNGQPGRWKRCFIPLQNFLLKPIIVDPRYFQHQWRSFKFPKHSTMQILYN